MLDIFSMNKDQVNVMNVVSHCRCQEMSMIKSTADFKYLLWISSNEHEKNLSSIIATAVSILFELNIVQFP